MDKKAAKLAYKASRRPIGVFAIRNLVNDKVFVGSSMDLGANVNRIRFQLAAGAHPNKELETDWRRLGPDKFSFEVLEELVPRDDPNFDYTNELEFLEDLWLEKLEPYGDRGYNERKKTSEERLRMIAANRGDGT
jgi:hypothetical protein